MWRTACESAPSTSCTWDTSTTNDSKARTTHRDAKHRAIDSAFRNAPVNLRGLGMTAKKKDKKPSSGAGSEAILPRDYSEWLSSLESLISSARQRATVAVNQELVRLYHHIGSQILERQTRQGGEPK